jgi:hypothetical protein
MKAEDHQLLALLLEEWELLMQSVSTLLKSNDKCGKLIIKKAYTFEDEESFDSLTSKFCRTSDIYTQKVLRTVRMLLHESFVPFIDNMNQLEKMGIIDSADDMIEIRDMRNQITHEYLPEAIHNLIPEVLSMTRVLDNNIRTTGGFFEKRGWLKKKK